MFRLEERIMDCWRVVDDIKVIYEEHLDSPEQMSEDEMANILLGLSTLYNRKFDRLFTEFEKVCRHGGIFLDKDLVEVAKQHAKYNEKLDNMFTDVGFPTKEDVKQEHISEPPDEYNNETQEEIDNYFTKNPPE